MIMNQLKFNYRIFRTILVLGIVIMLVASASAQSADEIIEKYIAAIGGRDLLKKTTSLYMEGKSDVGGMELDLRITVLNGAGYKAEYEAMGSAVVNCITPEGGWTINPFMGSGMAETMPESQFKEGKDQIYIGAPFSVYREKGYKAEYVGTEEVSGVKAFKIKLTSPDGVLSWHFFDPSTGYLMKTVQQAQAEGQTVEAFILYNDYRVTGGLALPFKTYYNLGNMFELTNTITKVELNKPVDATFFIKP